MEKDKLEEKLKKLPQKSGVYFLKDKAGEIIYVGKAKSIRDRVRSYFRKNKYDTPKVKALKSKIADFDIFVTDNEFEALVFESNMIKEHQPRYNVNLRQGQYYPYIKITDEPFPRLVITRNKKKDGSKYFGPYTKVSHLRKTVKLVKKIFQIRDCNHDLPEKEVERPCLNFDIDKCGAPCVGKISEEEYNENVKKVISFLKGHRQSLMENIKEKMDKASRKMNFQKAKVYKHQVEAIKETLKKQKVEINDFTDRDFINISTEEGVAIIILFQLREGNVIGQKEFQYEISEEDRVEEVLESFLRNYYKDNPNIPKEIALPLRLDGEEEFGKWLTGMREERGKVKLLFPQRGKKRKLLKLLKSNADLLLKEVIRTKDQTHIPKLIATLQDDLYLEAPPKTIEAFDVSNIGKSYPVGSMVYFYDGRPKKDEYRRFKIKTVDGQDDYSMMKELVHRRYRRLLDEERELPDLILIDGGQGQLSAALEVLDELDIREEVEIASLAKKLEEVYLPDKESPISLPRSSPALKLLQRVRDEAHRFAVNYHRKRREEGLQAKALTKIEGIGLKMQHRLLKHFKSLEDIKTADISQLTDVKGISDKTARKIKDFFNGEN